MVATKKAERRFSFTKESLEKLTPEEKTYYVYDTNSKNLGIGLRVNRNNTKTFILYRRFANTTGHGTRPERITLGRFPPTTIEQAVRKVKTLLAQQADEQNPMDAKRALRDSPTLGKLFEEYNREHINKRRKHPEEARRCFHRWLGHWENRNAYEIIRSDVVRLHTQIKENRGPYAANRAVQLLRATYNKAKQWGHFSGENPADKITPWKESSRTRVIRPEELTRFFVALEESESADFKDFVVLLLLTGQRKSNVLAMKWSDVSLEGSIWQIPGEQTKNGEPHTLTLTEPEIQILRRRKENTSSDFVFPGSGHSKHYVEPKRAWKTLLKRANITNFRVHDLRRSLASYMASTGANATAIQSALGHKDIKTTLLVYAHCSKPSEQAARLKAHEFILSQQPLSCVPEP